MSSISAELQRHYAHLLGLKSPWCVVEIRRHQREKELEIRLEWPDGARISCPVCGRSGAIYDRLPERAWRHLDTMQYQTVIRARTPRVDCSAHGIKTTAVPWATGSDRSTRAFGRWATQFAVATKNISLAARMLRLSWDELHHILSCAIERGECSDRDLARLKRMGLDAGQAG